MKEHDLYRVMKDIDRKYTDELHQYAAELVTTKRRRETMKQKVKTKAPAAQFLPWKIGIGATVVACAVIAVSIGGGIISLDKQMQVGSNVGTSVAEQISENTADEVKTAITVQHEPVEIIDKLIVSGGNDSTMMKLPPEGAVQVLRSVADAEACCQYSNEKIVAGENFDFRKKLTEDVFAEYDVLYFGFKDAQYPRNCYQFELAGGSIAEDGTTLKLDFHALMFDPEHLPAHWCKETEPDWNGYYFYTVPKNTLPDLNAIELNFEEYPIGEIPDEILAHANDLVDIEDNGYITKHTKLQEYLETTQEYLDWIMSMPKPMYITWENDAPVPPEECTVAESEILPEPFSAWYWVSYRGTSIPVTGIIDKCAETVDLIRTAADGEKYLTGDPEQNQTPLRTQLSKEWLETGFDEEQVTDPVSGTVFSIDPDHPVHDMLFIGVPASAMPSNVVRWDFHNGTITPSGKLHLDFSVQTVSETAIKALNAEYDADTNFYFFISIPEGSIPQLTDYEVTFSTYYTSAEPDAYTAEAPEEVGSDGMNRRDSWLSVQPESESYGNSVLGAKYITPIPEEQPGTVTLTNISACPIEEPPLENKPFFSFLQCGEIDNITLTLPSHDADVAVALSDLHVSADGILSLTLNEYYEKHDVDLTQDTASFQWVLGVPHGSLPEIKDMVVNRVICENEDAFIQIAGQLCTVTTE